MLKDDGSERKGKDIEGGKLHVPNEIKVESHKCNLAATAALSIAFED